MAPSPSCHSLLVLISLQLALLMLRGRSANLLPLLHLVLQIIAGHIHLCSGTGSVLKVSLKYTSQSPEECFGVTVQQQYFPLQVS